MLYTMTVAPFVNAGLLAFLDTLLHPAMPGTAFALALWLAGACHGIFIDFCCFRMSSNMLFMWLLMTCLASLTGGFMLDYMYRA
jgi:hypothetical protein